MMSQRSHSIGIVGVVTLLVLFVLAPVAWAAPSAQATDSVKAENQPIVDGTITVAEVNASQDGWIVAHLDEGGQPGEVLGQTAVKKGTNQKVAIKLSRDVPVGGKLWPMLHIDAGQLGTYEFPGPDAPVIVNNAVVMVQITVTEASAPEMLPPTGGEDAPAVLLAIGLALLAGGLLTMRIRRRHT